MNDTCYGIDLRDYDIDQLIRTKRINIQWMIDLYKIYPEKDKFFDRTQSREIGNIDVLAGVYDFRQQIIAGKSMQEIQTSWEPGLSRYKGMRKKYMLYP